MFLCLSEGLCKSLKLGIYIPSYADYLPNMEHNYSLTSNDRKNRQFKSKPKNYS